MIYHFEWICNQDSIFFLQQGKPLQWCSVYFPIYDKYSEPAKELLLHFDGMKPDFTGTDFETSAQSMYDHGYAFDYISDRQILQLQTLNKKSSPAAPITKPSLLPGLQIHQVRIYAKTYCISSAR